MKLSLPNDAYELTLHTEEILAVRAPVEDVEGGEVWLYRPITTSKLLEYCFTSGWHMMLHSRFFESFFAPLHRELNKEQRQAVEVHFDMTYVTGTTEDPEFKDVVAAFQKTKQPWWLGSYDRDNAEQWHYVAANMGAVKVVSVTEVTG